jgi:hypothetical protein
MQGFMLGIRAPFENQQAWLHLGRAENEVALWYGLRKRLEHSIS